MSLVELQDEVQRRRALGLEAIVLVVPGIRHGARCRVIPGVTGQVVSHNADGNTVAWVKLDAIERALKRLR